MQSFNHQGTSCTRRRHRFDGGNALAILFAVIPFVVHPRLAAAQLTFQRSTDVLGMASTFEEGTGLPTRNFTISTTVRSGSGRARFVIHRAGTLFSMAVYAASSGLLDVVIDSTSYTFDPSTVMSTEDSVMTLRTWTLTYHDSNATTPTGELSLYVDGLYVNTMHIAPLFPGESIFSQNAIPFLNVGLFALLSNDDEGQIVLSPVNDIDGLFGQFTGTQLWDRALNASEVVQTTAAPSSLSGTEEGLCIYWRADGYGTNIPNLGSAGSRYDAVLGAYATGGGVGETSSVYGSGCDAVSTTSPTWVNKTGGVNTPPTAESSTQQVRSWRACVSAHSVRLPIRPSSIRPPAPSPICVCARACLCVLCDAWYVHHHTGGRGGQRCVDLGNDLFCGR